VVLASGDGGFLMGLSDLESRIGAASSAIVVIYNDAAYGAEIHRYGFQRPDRKADADPGRGLQRDCPRFGCRVCRCPLTVLVCRAEGLDRRHIWEDRDQVPRCP
jgi:hypothetical protein